MRRQAPLLHVVSGAEDQLVGCTLGRVHQKTNRRIMREQGTNRLGLTAKISADHLQGTRQRESKERADVNVEEIGFMQLVVGEEQVLASRER